MRHLPGILIALRFCFAPVILVGAWHFGEQAVPLIMILMYAGLISDILDGIIARRHAVSTEKLRRLDSQTDMVFWLSIGIATWLLRRDLLIEHSLAISTVLVMEALCYLVSILKFGRETCTHALLSKLWGVTLLMAFTSLIGFNQAGVVFYTAVVVGFIAHLDVILIILLLPRWTHDIPSAWHALRIRQGREIARNRWFNG